MSGNQPSSGLVLITMIIYGLHIFSAAAGVLSPALVITSFLTGWPSVIALILSYLNRSNAQGTYLESHYRWVISTFWYALLWLIICSILFITFFGIPVALILLLVVGAWVLYRMARGVLALLSEKPLPFDE